MGFGFEVNLQDAKRNFFDRDAVMTRVDPATRKILGTVGAYTRMNARRLIRNRKSPSRPGQAPTNRTGLLKGFIFFSYDEKERSVVIGPARLRNSRGIVPEALEYGGETINQRGNTVTIEGRPYMTPAFTAAREDAAKLWRNSIRR